MNAAAVAMRALATLRSDPDAAAGVRVLEDALAEARRAVAAYYDGHREAGEHPCGCRNCTLARRVFATSLLLEDLA